MSSNPTTRDRILDAATHVITEQGLANATTRHIARAAGYSEATLYKHFSDKEELFFSVMRERVPTDFARFLGDSIAEAGTGTARDRLRDTACRALSFYRGVVPLLSGVFAEPTLLARHQEGMRATDSGPHLALPAFAEYVRIEQHLGRLPDRIDPTMFATLLLGACFQRAFLTRFVGEHIIDQSDDEFARAILDTLMPEYGA